MEPVKAVLEPDVIDVEYGNTYSATVTLSPIENIPDGSVIRYDWVVNNKFVGTGEATRTTQPSQTGNYVLSCRVFITPPNENTVMITTNKSYGYVYKNSDTSPVDAEILYDNKIYQIGSKVRLLAIANNPDTNYVKGIIWKDVDGKIIGIGREYIHTMQSEYDIVRAKVTMDSPIRDEFSKNFTIHLYAINVQEGTCIRYIHPLDHRDAGFIWCGWWVMDEVQRAIKLGLDWKNPKGLDLNYKCDLETLALLLKTYPEAEVQESRHGYIITRLQIETGEIYEKPYEVK